MSSEEEDKLSYKEEGKDLRDRDDLSDADDDFFNIDIMALMARENLSAIKADFLHLNPEDGLLDHEWVKIMLHHLQITDKKSKIRLIGSLLELFAQIDVNGNKRLEWDEFSNYIIELGMIRKDRTFLDAIKDYTQVDWKDQVKHDSEIEHMHYLPHLRHLVVADRDCSAFNVYNMHTGRRHLQVRGHRGAVISWAHARQFGQVATSSNDLTINLWDEQTYVLKQRISVPDIQLCLAWDSSHQVLYGGGADAVVYTFDLDEQRGMRVIPGLNPFKRSENGEEGHSGPITALLPIKNHNILASAGMDGRIFLWDMPQNTFRKEMDTPKSYKKGIYSLDWNREQNCLFSAGLDHDCYVWNPYVPRSIYQLKGHIHSLTGVKWIPNTPQVITADITGMFKIWDIRTHTTIQSFNIPSTSLNCFDVSYPYGGTKSVEKRIIAGANQIWQYKYDEPKDQHLADEGMSLCTIYNSVFNYFISAHPKSIKIWNAINGEIKHIFREATKYEITCIKLDYRQRKLFVGDSAGKVFTLDIKNGTKIKKFQRHTDEVTWLYYWEGSEDVKFLISSSWDGQVIVHDDSSSATVGTVRYNKIRHRASCNYVSFKENEGIVASCSDDWHIQMTNLHTYRQEAHPLIHEAEVKICLFLNPHNVIASCDLAGKLYFWSTMPSRLRNKKLLEILNTVTTITGETDEFPIRALAFYEVEQFLYTGDENGTIRKWNLQQLLAKVKAQGVFIKSMMPDSEETKRERNSPSKPSNAFLTEENLTVHDQNPYQGLYSVHAQNGAIYEEDVPLVYEWKAHKDSINHLLFVENPQCLVSSSFDCNIYIWNLDAEQLGSLTIGYNNVKWRIRPDIQSKKASAKQEAYQMLEKVSKGTYEELIQSQGHRNPDHNLSSDSLPKNSSEDDPIVRQKINRAMQVVEEMKGRSPTKKQRNERNSPEKFASPRAKDFATRLSQKYET